jgi:3'(2'), 5'-bisphosphate nucleotidase
MPVPPPTDAAFASWLAERVGAALFALREETGFDDPGALRAAGDRLAHNMIMESLQRWRSADAVLSEEGKGSRDAYAGGELPKRLSADRVWIVDPLDGTREYGEPGREDWAVHIALWQRTGASLAFPMDSDPADAGLSTVDGVGPVPEWPDRDSGRLVAGAVALPAQFRVIDTAAPPAYPPLGSIGTPLRIAVSRSRPPAFVAAIADELGADLIPMGSAGAKIAAVVTGDVDAYVHAGGQYEWDSAAPVAVAVATGLHTSRTDGTTLEYNRPDPRLPDLVVCRKDLADRLLAALTARVG